jgi:hypothetical protein
MKNLGTSENIMAKRVQKAGAKQISLAGIFYDITRKPFYKDMDAIRLLNYLMEQPQRPSVILPIAKLNATQTHVNDDYDRVFTRYKPCDKDVHPAVVKYQSKFYVVDGHHRIYAQYRYGKKVVEVGLLDLDRNTQFDMPLLGACA